MDSFYGRNNIGMSCNIKYGMQHEFNFDMGTNFGEHGEESCCFAFVFYQVVSFPTRAHLLA